MTAESPPDRCPPVTPAAWPTQVVPRLAVDPPGDRRRFDSQQLFGSGHEVEIAHAGAVYRLRRTALGKLILTK